MTKRYDIMWVNKTESTNEEVRRRIPDIDNLSVVSAFEQSDGRGHIILLSNQKRTAFAVLFLCSYLSFLPRYAFVISASLANFIMLSIPFLQFDLLVYP